MASVSSTSTSSQYQLLQYPLHSSSINQATIIPSTSLYHRDQCRNDISRSSHTDTDDSTYILTSSDDHTVKLFHLRAKSLFFSITLNSPVLTCKIIPSLLPSTSSSPSTSPTSPPLILCITTSHTIHLIHLSLPSSSSSSSSSTVTINHECNADTKNTQCHHINSCSSSSLVEEISSKSRDNTSSAVASIQKQSKPPDEDIESESEKKDNNDDHDEGDNSTSDDEINCIAYNPYNCMLYIGHDNGQCCVLPLLPILNDSTTAHNASSTSLSSLPSPHQNIISTVCIVPSSYEYDGNETSSSSSPSSSLIITGSYDNYIHVYRYDDKNTESEPESISQSQQHHHQHTLLHRYSLHGLINQCYNHTHNDNDTQQSTVSTNPPFIQSISTNPCHTHLILTLANGSIVIMYINQSSHSTNTPIHTLSSSSPTKHSPTSSSPTPKGDNTILIPLLTLPLNLSGSSIIQSSFIPTSNRYFLTVSNDRSMVIWDLMKLLVPLSHSHSTNHHITCNQTQNAKNQNKSKHARRNTTTTTTRERLKSKLKVNQIKENYLSIRPTDIDSSIETIFNSSSYNTKEWYPLLQWNDVRIQPLGSIMNAAVYAVKLRYKPNDMDVIYDQVKHEILVSVGTVSSKLQVYNFGANTSLS